MPIHVNWPPTVSHTTWIQVRTMISLSDCALPDLVSCVQAKTSLPRNSVWHHHLQSYLVEFMYHCCYGSEGDVFVTFLSHVAEVSNRLLCRLCLVPSNEPVLRLWAGLSSSRRGKRVLISYLLVHVHPLFVVPISIEFFSFCVARFPRLVHGSIFKSRTTPHPYIPVSIGCS